MHFCISCLCILQAPRLGRKLDVFGRMTSQSPFMSVKINSLRVGTCNYFNRMGGRSYLNVQLWGADSSDAEELIQCGQLQIEGKFRESWRAQAEIGREAFQFTGSKQTAVLEIPSGEQSPLSFKCGVFSPLEMSARIGGEEWKAQFPKTLILDGNRSKDKHVSFTCGSRSFKLCIFPAEHYGGSSSTGKRILLPATRPILHELPQELIETNLQLMKSLIALGLLGFGFFR